MTPELSRQLARLANQYDARKDADLDLCLAFRRFIREHEEAINSLEEIPARYSSILSVESFLST